VGRQDEIDSKAEFRGGIVARRLDVRDKQLRLAVMDCLGHSSPAPLHLRFVGRFYSEFFWTGSGDAVCLGDRKVPPAARWRSQRNLQPHFFHRQERFSISSRVVHRIMCVLGCAQVFEVLGHILDHSLV
jgi:hypothetical protein